MEPYQENNYPLFHFCLTTWAGNELIAINNWRVPTSTSTIHNLPFGLKNFAKPDMASQNRRKKLHRYIQLSTTRRNFLRRFWARRANCWLLHYCLKPFNLPFRLRSFAKPDIASQNMRWFIQLYQNNWCNLLRCFLMPCMALHSFWILFEI